jgi:ABC-type branched-subunit amino acid transport system ATPase component
MKPVQSCFVDSRSASPGRGRRILSMASSKLEVNNMRKAFGGLQAVNDVSFSIPQGSVTGLIGPNGSGKTTLFNCITKLLKPDSGSVFFNGQRVDQLSSFKIARKGIRRTFQEVRLFRELTVMENMGIAAMGAGIHGWKEKAFVSLERMGVIEKIETKCINLSVGQQKLVELAMCLMVESDFIMLDEPVAGVNPVIEDHIVRQIQECRAEGKTFLIIEHDIPFIMSISDTIIVLHLGQKLAEGKPADIQGNDQVLQAYLGRSVNP